MSKLDTKEFSVATGIKIGTVRAHISRGKLIRDSEGYIDTDLEKNRSYIHQQTKGKGLFSNSVIAEAKPDKKISESNPEKIVSNDKRTLDQQRRDEIIDDLEIRKKQAELDNAERSAELKKLEIEKRAGRLLPVELVQKIISINIQAIFKDFDNESDVIAGIFTEVFGGGRAELADITKRMRESLAISIKSAKETSLFEINQAIDEYSEVRSRGERK